jgi:phosphatidylinositol glycan class W
MTIYQIALSFGGVQQYIETASRTCENESDVVPCIPFFAANREGILGCIGYLSLYFMGEYVGLEFLWKRESLWKLTAIVWAMFGSLAQTVSVSRRSTNASFCLWATAHNLLILALCQTFLTGGNIPIIFETVNKHGLPMFLIANLLTGLVNLTIPTLEVGNLLALIIIFGYICLIGMVAILLDTVIGKTKGTKKEKSS